MSLHLYHRECSFSPFVYSSHSFDSEKHGFNSSVSSSSSPLCCLCFFLGICFLLSLLTSFPAT